MDALLQDWFGPGGVVSTGITTAGSIVSAQANAAAAQQAAIDKQRLYDQQFTQGLQVQALTQGGQLGGKNLLVLVMVGVIALFVISQAR